LAQIFLEPPFNFLAKKPKTLFNDHFPFVYPTHLHIQVAYIFCKDPTIRKKNQAKKRKKEKKEKKGKKKKGK